jgi:hypothetical protein
MAPPAPPIVLLEDSYQRMFGSLDELIAYVEAIDVRDGIYTVIDAGGQVIALSADSDSAPVRARLTDEFAAIRLEHALREVVAPNPGRWGLIDAGVGLDGLLRALWRAEFPKRAFPT